MKINSTNMLFKSMIIMGLLMSMSSSNWILIWAGMEIMLISFIPTMNNDSVMYSESAIKYFIVQSISSALLILGVLMMIMKMNYSLVILTSMLIKLATFPFSIWFISVIQGIELKSMFNMLVTMKIIPIMITCYLNMNLSMITILTLTSSALMILNQTSMLKIIAYSSVYNLGLLLTTISMQKMWMLYMMIYSVIIKMLLKVMEKMKISFINQIIMSDNNKPTKLNLWIIMLSSMGMPPMLGFLNKMMIFETLMMKPQSMVIIIVIMSSMAIMFMYMRTSYMSMIMQSMQMKLNKTNISTSINLTLINMITLPISMMLF